MIERERFSLYREKYGLTQDQLGEIVGITGKYVGMIERGVKTVDKKSPLGILFEVIEHGPPPEAVDKPDADKVSRNQIRPVVPNNRMIPVVSWAHAGEAASFEELPHSWQDLVPTECKDEKAFAVRLVGDSMQPQFSEGDLLIVQPSVEIFSGCLAVVRLTNDGVVFRRVEMRRDVLRLIPLNPQYTAEEISRSEVAWAYPLWGMWRQVWK